jgi:signal transduction histidine kinase
MSKKKTVLYIEDDPASRRLVDRVLSNKGYHVVLADDGLEGLRCAKQYQPQLILIDINLPNLDGREITTRLRSLPNFAGIPIVALTANNSPGSRELALAAGCSGFLTKPINVSQFPTQVHSFLQGHVEPLAENERYQHLERHAKNLVTRLEKKVNELEVANQRLRELDRLKSDFILMVSHELRTPLTLISGYAHLLDEQLRQAEESLTPEMVAGVAEGLNLGVTRMRDVVNEIIKVGRITSGTLDLALGPVRIGDIVEELCQQAASALQERNLQLHLGDLSKLPVVQADGTQLKSAIDHVLSNAIKFTPDGGNIYIVGRVFDDTSILIIRDTGIGIPSEEQRRIFEQFYTLSSIENHSTSKYAFKGGGLGLGLGDRQGDCEAHNGRIWVESDRRDPDTLPGSTFHLLLPHEQDKSTIKI